jgi:arylsulfatase A-like enzyme
MKLLQKPFRSVARFTLLLLCALYIFPVQAQFIECGAPTINQTVDRGIFLWRDCNSAVWSVRGTGAGSYAGYFGSITATYPFESVTPFSLEAHDLLQLPDSTTLQFNMRIWGTSIDGFDFVLPIGANACFELVSPDEPVYVGPTKQPLTPPFDLLNLCDKPAVVIGAPDYDASVDQEIFLWKTADDVWHVRATGGGAAIKFTGQIQADRAFTSISNVSIEADDVVDTTDPSLILFDFKTDGQEDGIDFSFPDDASVCFTLNTPVQPVRVGATEIPVLGSFQLETLTSCGGTTPDPDGQPVYDSSTQAALFLWRDAPGSWHLRATAGGGAGHYTGSIVSDQVFSAVNAVSLESHDTLDTSDPDRIEFDLLMWNAAEDGIDFEFPPGATVCFTLNAPSQTLLLGVAQTAVDSPLDLDTLGPCLPAPGNGEQLNFMVIYTDDQRFDTLAQMPNVQSKLVARGVTFANAYVPTPLCCPSRATTFSGGYLSQNTSVLTNKEPNGGVIRFDDSNTLGTVLQNAGYETQFVGKWLNDYPGIAPYIPPGWDSFVGRASWATTTNWFAFNYGVGSSGANSENGRIINTNGQYTAYFEGDHVLEFLDQVPSDKPFFSFWSTSAPHAPATPAPGDEGLFSDFIYRDRAYYETDLSDKPSWIRNYTGLVQDDVFVRKQLRSLQAVDRLVGAIVDKVAAMGRLDNTVFIFTSDNGYLWGEHGMWGKNKPHEESVRVPMVVVMPGVAARVDDSLVSATLDMGPTLYELAGVPRETDGMSLVALLKDPASTWRNELFLEKYIDNTYTNAVWIALRNQRWKYIEYWTGDEEFYDLLNDPFELESRHADASVASIKQTLKARANALKGLVLVPVRTVPKATAGVNYRLQLQTWGGTEPYSWRIFSGGLPAGLVLNKDTGLISGTPTTVQTSTFKVEVKDSSVAAHTGEAQVFISHDLTIIVD